MAIPRRKVPTRKGLTYSQQHNKCANLRAPLLLELLWDDLRRRAALAGFRWIQLLDGDLRNVFEQRELWLVKVARLGIENAERADTTAVAEDQRVTGIEADSRIPRHIGVIGEPLI